MYPQAASPPNIAGFGGSGAYVPPPGQNQQPFPQPFPPQQQQQQQQQSGFGAPSPSPATQTHGMPQYPQPHNVSNGGSNGQPRNDNRQLAVDEVKVVENIPNNGTPEVTLPPTTEKKKEEKNKRETRMVYGDNEMSPVSTFFYSPFFLFLSCSNQRLTRMCGYCLAGGKEGYATEVRVSSS
jgi:hypothetical protein